MPFNKDGFAKKLRQYRRQKGLKQEELASLIGKKKSIISEWENGKRVPAISVIQKLASVLDVSLSDLIDVIEEPTEGSFGEKLSFFLSFTKEGHYGLAEQLNRPIEDINRMCADDLDPCIDELDIIADYLDVTVQQLIRRSPASSFCGSVSNDPCEQELVNIYHDLNSDGQSVLMGTARGLAANPDMKNGSESKNETS